MAGRDPVAREQFDASWQRPAVRAVHRRITVVWGSAFLGEFAIRVTLAYTLPAAAVLVIAPILLGLITVGTFVWTIAYVGRVRRRADTARSGGAAA